MWLLVARPPPPDARVWRGRRALAFVDAVAWPMGWAVLASMVTGAGALVGQVLIAGCFVAALGRAHEAIVRNHRYRFTTWRWGRHLTLVLAFGFALRLAELFAASW